MIDIIPRIIKCRKCGKEREHTDFYICSGVLKKWCKTCMKKENMRTKKLRDIKREQEKVNKKKGIKPVVVKPVKKRKYTKTNKNKPKVYGWNGDDEIFY